MKILIVRLDRIGDVVLSTPVIKALRDAYPKSRISFLTGPHCREILEGNPHLDEVIIYDKKERERGILGNLRFISRLRKIKFDLAVILHPTNRSHLIAFLAGIPERVGYDKKMGILLTKKIPHLKQLGLKHEIDYTLDILRYIGIEPKERRLCMPINDDSELKVGDIFAKCGIKEGDLVITLNPGGSCPSKRWGLENYIKVGNDAARRYGARIVVICGSLDKSLGDNVADSISAKAVNLSGRTTVGDLASVLRRSRLLISNDSGPVHIACAVGTPVIAIFGRSDRGLSPERWGPTGEDDVALHKDVGCAVCLAHNCELGFKCLEAITVDEVLKAAEKILG